MRPAKVVIDVREGQLVAQALFAFTEGDHAPSDGGYMLADGEIEVLNEGRVDLPAVGSQHVLHGSSGVEHHAVPHAHYSATAIGLDHLGIEELRRICRKFHFEALWGKISFAAAEDHTRGSATMVSFKGTHFVKDIILTCVRWYVAYPLSYRHVEELMQERGVWVDHSTVNRWVLKYSPQLEAAFHCRKRPVWLSWRMDETDIKVKGHWYYLYRAVDKHGQTIDFLLTEHRDERAATRFLTKAIRRHGVPAKITIDGSEANAAAIRGYNEEHGTAIIIRQVKYLNNVVEQDHRGVKRVTRPMLGFKSFAAAQATLIGIELMHMLKKGQLVGEARAQGLTPVEQFYTLAA